MQFTVFSRLLPILVTAAVIPGPASPPAVGDKAPDFALSTLHGKKVRLSDATAKGTVVLVLLRGYPGYQCPLCKRQVQDLLRNADSFAQLDARVIMVYPGPAENLESHAKEFAADRQFPGNVELALDPDYEFTNLYGLRWNAPRETAYPATFLIDGRQVVFFSKISNSHGGRTDAAEILDQLRKKKAAE